MNILINILSINKVELLNLKNNNKMDILPAKAPNINLKFFTFIFNILLTPISKDISNI